MTTSVPFTWEEMRARFEPTIPTEEREICRQIPASSIRSSRAQPAAPAGAAPSPAEDYDLEDDNTESRVPFPW